MLRRECPICCGEGGFKDYYGEWSECECCNRDGRNETGRAWFWQVWRYRLMVWRQDRAYARMMRDPEMQ